MDNTYLTRTVGTPTNIDKYTFSVWIKRGDIGQANSKIFSVSSGSSYGEEKLEFNADAIKTNLTDTSGNNYWSYTTNRKFKDPLAYYHLVLSVDTTLGTPADRVKLYVNGVQETSFSSSTNSPQDRDSYINKNGSTIYIGRLHNGSSQNFGGVMSHMHFIDGTAYTASTFGSTDPTTGEWTINTSPSVTYGNNGFFILKDGTNLSGSTVQDQSGNSNNFTVGGGTLTKTEDNPSNVFATLNPLYGNGSYGFTNGNNSLEGNNTNSWATAVLATIGATSGKYYWEVRQVAGSQTDYNLFGFMQTNYSYTGSNLISTSYLNGIQTHQSTTVTVYNGTDASTYLKAGGSQISVSDNDIVSFALDLDNQKGWVAKNGVYSDDLNGYAGNPSAGSYALWTSSVIPSGQLYAPVSIQYYDPRCQYNFGNGFFGTTEITTNTGTGFQDADGNGRFFYNPPTNFKCLSTKGINQ